MKTVKGPVYTWQFARHSRLYSTITLPFQEATELMRVNAFDGLQNKGEQRVQTAAHVNAIAGAVEDGVFTPTPWSCNVPDELQNRLVMSDGCFELQLQPNEFLSQTDGGGRRRALLSLFNSAQSRLLKEKHKPSPDLDVIASCSLVLEDIQAMPVTVTIYLDGDPAKDFLNLQKGRPVDKTTIFAMENAVKVFDDPAYQMAVDVAKLLHKDKASPFFGNVRFDSISKCSLPISTLCAKGASDLSTSLIGLAIIGDYLGLGAQKLAACITRTFASVEKRYPDLLQNPSPLTPLSNSGTKAASCMWVGIGTLLALKAGHGSLDANAQELSECCYEVFQHVEINGAFTSSMKRVFMGDLAKAYFRGVENVTLHEDVPLLLCQYLSATAYNTKPLKKEQRITRS